MKKQFTSSLKKSIIAEQKVVAAKNPTIMNSTKDNYQTTSEDIEVKKIISKTKETLQKNTTTKTAPATKSNIQNVALNSFVKLEKQNNELIKISLNAVNDLNQEIKNYMSECMLVNNIDQLIKLNISLFTKLATKQKQLVEQTLSIMRT